VADDQWRSYSDQAIEQRPGAPTASTPKLVSTGRELLVGLPGGGYRRYPSQLVPSELETLWQTSGLRCRDDDGKLLPISRLYRLYGRSADQIIYSYLSSDGWIEGDNRGGTLVLRVCKSARPNPVFHAECQEWLEALFGDRWDDARDWIVALPRLDRPVAGLILYGDPGTGKSMFGLACSRFFGRESCSYNDVFHESGFNDALLRNPVVLCDEAATVDAPSEAFRSLIANRSHPIRAKNQPSSTLEGCPRLLVVAQDPDPLRLGNRSNSRATEEAIGRRLIVVECSTAARDLLEARGAPGHTEDWIDGRGMLLQHLAWIASTHQIQRPGKRLLVDGDAERWVATIRSRVGLPASILEALETWLDLTSIERREMRERTSGRRPLAHFLPEDPDGCHVSNSALRSHWRQLVGETERVPSASAVRAALEILGGPPIHRRVDGTRARLHRVSLERIRGEDAAQGADTSMPEPGPDDDIGRHA